MFAWRARAKDGPSQSLHLGTVYVYRDCHVAFGSSQ
jgi:hypothetical protein